MDSGTYIFEILRLTPQNDVVGLPLKAIKERRERRVGDEMPPTSVGWINVLSAWGHYQPVEKAFESVILRSKATKNLVSY